jgi:hypothetical protein
LLGVPVLPRARALADGARLFDAVAVFGFRRLATRFPHTVYRMKDREATAGEDTARVLDACGGATKPTPQ